jgi:pimeloyl-ACP methyl ester carboxylesterase
MKKLILNTLKIITILYVAICVLLYLFQEKLIFYPNKLTKDYIFYYPQPFEELHIKTKDNAVLSALLFKAIGNKGVIFYLHGNAGSLESWGDAAKTYTAIGYDVFMLDYRGYGKSDAVISSEQQLYNDVQTAYDTVKARYSEDKIVVLGYSIGTGAAAKTASTNHPRLLILQAPYYSLTDMMRHTYPIIPTFILKYKFPIDAYLPKCTMPIVIFHGDNDEVIYYNSSVKLKQLMKPADTLITLHGQGHNGITENEDYKKALVQILQ